MKHFLTLSTLLLASGTASAQLELPDRSRAVRPPTRSSGERAGAEGAEVRGRPADSAAASSAPAPTATSALLENLFSEVERHDDPNATVPASAVNSLLELGEEGLRAARARLESTSATVWTTCVRALLAGGAESDLALVRDRMKRRIPGRAVEPGIRAVLEHTDEERSEAWLVELLAHAQLGVRVSAHRVLAEISRPALLPRLVDAIGARRTDSRMRILQLAAEIDHPSVLHLLSDRLGDASAKVAYEAASRLAVRPEPEVEELLLTEAFASGIDADVRRAAYALIAVVEREDAFGVPLLGDERIPALLEGLGSSHPARSGACALALAGVGFRSTEPESTTWLDLEVPHALVRIVSGTSFHSDLSSLQGGALRRLVLLSGVSKGSDGPSWMSWWTREASDFRARRAVMDVDVHDVGAIRMDVGTGTERFSLAGPDALAVQGEPFFLTGAEALDLFAVLKREGIFGADRLPGSSAAAAGDAAWFEVVVADQRKRFAAQVSEDRWFEKVVAYAEALRDRNSWQTYAPRGDTRREFWLSEREWWGEPRDDVERDRHLVELVLAWVRGAPRSERDRGLEELARLFERPGASQRADIWQLADLIEDERFASGRAERAVDLCTKAASEAGADAASALRRVAEALVAGPGASAEELLSRVLVAGGPELARAFATHAETFARAAAAQALVDDPAPVSREQFLRLLSDPAVEVEAAAVRAAGRTGGDHWRDEILERARFARPGVRPEALRVAGRLGGDEVRTVLVTALRDPAQLPDVRVAAVEGLADLADPETLPLLVTLFSRGPHDLTFDAARRGLAKLGATARADVLRIAQARHDPARREAALMLSRQCVAEVASTLMAILTESPGDQDVARELVILTGVDLRSEPDPATAWWEWWDLVVHDDSIAWFRAAAERRGWPSPDSDQVRTTRRGAEFLLKVLELATSEELAERARRELELNLESELEALPPAGKLRASWIESLRARVESRHRD